MCIIKQNPLISIIIPTYNRADLIEQTISSVLNQTYQNFEIIICDDGSTDNTNKIINSFEDKRIRYIYSEHTGLPASMRNLGLRVAIGKYIGFLDSDDLWFPKKLEKQIKILDYDKNLLGLSSNASTINSNLDLKKQKYFFKSSKKISFNELSKKNIIITSSVLIKREVLNNVGFMDENKLIKAMEDFDYWLRILNYKDNSILILNKPLVKYRIHKNQLVKNVKNYSNVYKRIKQLYYIYRKFYYNNQIIIIVKIVLNFIYYFKNQLIYIISNS